MDPARAQIMLHAPQRRIEEDLYILLTQRNRVDLDFYIQCWVSPLLRQGVLRACAILKGRALSITNPKRCFHPTHGEYAAARVYFLVGASRRSVAILMPRKPLITGGNASLSAYHGSGKLIAER